MIKINFKNIKNEMSEFGNCDHGIQSFKIFL